MIFGDPLGLPARRPGVVLAIVLLLTGALAAILDIEDLDVLVTVGGSSRPYPLPLADGSRSPVDRGESRGRRLPG